ncbi:MAG: DNA-3-methyladenine glycosylase [Armatimonadota bacterium]
MKGQVLPREFYLQPTLLVAELLIGKVLVSRTSQGVASGMIVETEAYTLNDPANHGCRGKTKRNATMFGDAGHAYVYAVHASHCLNIVTEPAGVPCAVLIRALEPLEGVDLMRCRRKVSEARLLTSGPGRLCQALGIDCSWDGTDVTLDGGSLWVVDVGTQPGPIVRTPRIGIRAAV